MEIDSLTDRKSPLPPNDFGAATSLAETTAVEDSEMGEESGENGMKPPSFFKYRLCPENNATPPELPGPIADKFQEPWNVFWNEAIAAVQACDKKTGKWAMFCYPTLLTYMGLVAVLVAMTVFFVSHEEIDEVWRVICTVIVCFAFIPVQQTVDKRFRNKHRYACLQEIRHEAGRKFLETKVDIKDSGMAMQCPNDHQAILLCDDHTSTIDKIHNKTGIYVSLWFPSPDNLDENESGESTNKEGTPSTPVVFTRPLQLQKGLSLCYPHHPHSDASYYRVLVHKGNWFRKLFGRFDDVPSVRSTILSQPPPLSTIQTDDWEAFWENVEQSQHTLQTFDTLVDGLTLLLYPVFMTLFAAQQLKEWKIFGACLGFLVLSLAIFIFRSRRKNLRLRQTLPDKLKRAKALERRLYQSAGVYMDYRVVHEHEAAENSNKSEECHYICIFTKTTTMKAAMPIITTAVSGDVV